VIRLKRRSRLRERPRAKRSALLGCITGFSDEQDADARESARILSCALPRRDENADREEAEKRAPIHH
jgi:hypothetical protein